MVVKEFLTMNEWNGGEVLTSLSLAQKIKANPSEYASSLSGKSLAMLFEKNSTRTRMSFEAAMTQLGGHAMFLDWNSTHLGKAELKDEIRCIERFADIIMARVYAHSSLETMAKYSNKPIINALSEKFHPCQIMADLLTIKEKFGHLQGLKLAFIGDGNNVCNSLIIGCKKVGMKISVACPAGYEPQEKPDMLTANPSDAAEGADVVYTDTWVSMGQEAEKQNRLKDFSGYGVDAKLLGSAYFMHCLPACRGYEVSDEVMDCKKSIVFDQAENRLHAQKAIILKLLGVA